jgi:hypothetical protein
MNIDDLNIKKRIIFDDIGIYLYEVPMQKIFNKNIVCKDNDGNILWQIKDVSEGIEPLQDWPFTNIEPYNNEKIIAVNYNGWQYYVSIKTGEMELRYNGKY